MHPASTSLPTPIQTMVTTQIQTTVQHPTTFQTPTTLASTPMRTIVTHTMSVSQQTSIGFLGSLAGKSTCLM